MQKHVERDDIILLAIELEFRRVVALVAVEDQQPAFAFYAKCYIAVEVLDPIQAYYISSLAIIGSYNALVGREVALSILVSEVVLPSQDNEGGDGLTKGIDALDHRCLFTVARLGQLCPAQAIRGRNYYTCEDDAYYKPSFVEVIDVVFYDAILSFNILHQGKPPTNNLQIFVFRLLVVVSIRTTRIDRRLALEEVIYLLFTDRGHIAFVL